ncbi:MAG TPA: histidine triad nucleotide-binding protein [Candidatus Marinimicrobia bacterium]|jgi:histidine triad (HIT) family protein|nr:histidine triad nucleotide-binding protein [Candidatus Neomarinimicrobiota bacterium]MBD72788.1 histidine triad nucleotide-binding protein [Candidatus Neomarinimicrobiota bacterium]HIA23407.1 histidine triad nucleotide-binding protein [Candidatus Neomarinimicrobiota bacterium]|tara:strand:+ start:430 stop:774 length:345 start_codon:yes stop_codon:yes gene_type:complete
MDDCLFCKIVAGDIPADKVFENNNIYAFRDIDPKAPTHILIIPKEHISTTNDLDESHKTLVGEIMLTAKEIAGQEGIADSGYRTVFNCNQDGGQAVYHIHLHLLGGRHMNWPPG